MFAKDNKYQNQGSYSDARVRAERIPSVAQRHQHHPSLAARTPQLLEAAASVLVKYDEDAGYTDSTQTLLKNAETTVDALYSALREWVAVFGGDVPDLDLARYDIDRRKPDEVIACSKQLLEAVRAYGEANSALPYADQLVAEVERDQRAAEAANVTAKAVRATRKEKRLALREAISRMHRALIRYRRVLGRVIGRTHPDYLALRFRMRRGPERPLEPPVASGSTPGSEPGAPQA